MNDPLEFSPWQNNPLDWMTRELNKKNAKLKGYTPRYNKSVPFDRSSSMTQMLLQRIQHLSIT